MYMLYILNFKFNVITDIWKKLFFFLIIFKSADNEGYKCIYIYR